MTHAPAHYPTEAAVERLARAWPGVYPVPSRDGQHAYRVDRNQNPPALTVSCVCGDWHGHPMHDHGSPLAIKTAS